VGRGRERETGRGKDRFKLRALFAHERRAQAILDFIHSTDVGRGVVPMMAAAEEDAQSEVSEWKSREREERGGGRPEMGGLGMEWGERLQFFPKPSFMASAEEV